MDEHAGGVGTSDRTGAPALPIEIRRSTAQLARIEIGQWAWFIPSWALIFLPTGLLADQWPSPWYLAVLVVMVAVAIAFDVRRRRKEVLRLTEHGLYSGRDDGKKLAWLAPKPIELRWGEIRAIRVTTTRWSRKVLIDTTGWLRVLGFPVSGWFSRDPAFDERVDLIRRTWEVQRGPLPPPPAPPWFLPTERTAPTVPAPKHDAPAPGIG